VDGDINIGKLATVFGDNFRNTDLVDRARSFPPTDCSRFLMDILRAGWERLTSVQASAKLWDLATATKACNCLIDTFIYITN